MLQILDENDKKVIETEISELKEDVTNQKERLNDIKLISKQGNEWYDITSYSKIIFSSTNEALVYSYKKNQFISPIKLGKYSNTSLVSNIQLNEENIIASIGANKQYGNITLNPLFLKAGVYTISASFEILSGNATGNIGYIYVRKCHKDGTDIANENFSSIQLSKDVNTSKSTFTLLEDSYIKFLFYVNLNGTVTSDLTLKWFDLSINKESNYSGYEKYQGQVIKGTSGTFESYNNMNLISDSEIIISYESTNGSSYEDIKKQVSENTENIKKINNQVIDKNIIICWGDSLTNGTGSNNKKPSNDTNDDVSYPAVLSRLTNREVKNYGVGGEPSWMISARSGHNEICVEPFTIPSDTNPIRIFLHGQEQDYFYDNQVGKWTYLENNLSYNIAVDDENSGVNPIVIAGIKGKLTRTLISSGTPDPDTGETVQGSTYAYYFSRLESGDAKTLICRTPIITNAYKEYDNAIKIIWMGQNDAPLHDGKYITQGSALDRIASMCNGKYIVMSLPTGNNSQNASNEQNFSAKFGANYINIRDYICKNGIAIANGLGANLEISESDQKLLESGSIPSCLRSDSVHGNYWYYQIVAKAVFDKGVVLGYW